MILILLLSLPCVLGYNVLSNVRFFGGKDTLDSEDFLVSSLILPLLSPLGSPCSDSDHLYFRSPVNTKKARLELVTLSSGFSFSFSVKRMGSG
ncbi:MAG: hypothetical protein IJ225_02050 [Solobacterium sp.]|nr:hypothetical protein [Solobacterium sp.]